MHGYFWSRKRLAEELKEFTDGQFLIVKLAETESEEFPIENERKLVLRCEIKRLFIPDMNKRRILVYFGALWELQFGIDEYFKTKPKWVLIDPPPSSEYLDIEYTTFYFQRTKRRIKMWTPMGEVCRFYKKDDPSNVR